MFKREIQGRWHFTGQEHCPLPTVQHTDSTSSTAPLSSFPYFIYPSSGILWNKTKPKRNKIKCEKSCLKKKKKSKKNQSKDETQMNTWQLNTCTEKAFNAYINHIKTAYGFIKMTTLPLSCG